MKERYEIKLAGVGGQGIVLAGLVLAEAAVRDGKNVLQTQSYGAENRGGASVAEIIIAENDIAYPKVLRADLLLAMSQDAYVKNVHDLAEDGTLIVDSSIDRADEIENGYSLPIFSLAKTATGSGASATMVALGIIAGLTKVLTPEAILKAVEVRTPRGSEDRNRAAVLAGLQKGVSYAKERGTVGKGEQTR